MTCTASDEVIGAIRNWLQERSKKRMDVFRFQRGGEEGRKIATKEMMGMRIVGIRIPPALLLEMATLTL
jgi:hypothetical protein